jgi:phage terminase large subunit
MTEALLEDRRPHSYVPRPQFVEFHHRHQRWAAIVAHRRLGKTVACVNDLIAGATGMLLPYQHARFQTNPHPLRFAYVAPLYRQAKQVAWDYLRSYGREYPGTIVTESELKVDFPITNLAPQGGQVRLYGADNPDTLRGIYLDGVILDEAADMNPKINEVIRPTLSDHLGWAVWIGTPRGQNDFYDLIHGTKEKLGAMHDKDWFFRLFRASETKMLEPDELLSARGQLTKEQYAQEYECSFQAAILGSYYGELLDECQSEGRIVPNLYDPTLEVNTAWDLGHSNNTAVWFYQQHAMEIRVIDFYWSSKQDIPHYVGMLRERSRECKKNGYIYGKHYLPHDVGVVELSTGRSRIDSFRQLGFTAMVTVPKIGLDDGINAAYKIFSRCWFDSVLCREGIKALRQYHREWSEDRKTFIERPYHDWSADPADAFRYLAIGLREVRATRPKQRRNTGQQRGTTQGWVY